MHLKKVEGIFCKHARLRFYIDTIFHNFYHSLASLLQLWKQNKNKNVVGMSWRVLLQQSLMVAKPIGHFWTDIPSRKFSFIVL